MNKKMITWLIAGAFLLGASALFGPDVAKSLFQTWTGADLPAAEETVE